MTDQRSPDVFVAPPKEEKLLPPLELLVIPATTTKSARIRWLIAMGYKVAEISNHLGIKYQMVRNIATTEPKRAAREDLPPLVVVMREPVDDVQAIADAELEQSLKKGRKDRQKSQEGGEDQ